MLNLIVNTTDPQQDGLLDSFESPGKGIEQDFVLGDRLLALYHRPVVPSITNTRPWDDDWIDTDSFQVAIGNVDATPTGGTFPLTITTTVSAIPYNVTAAALTTSLSAVSVTDGKGPLTVTLLSTGNYKVTWTNNGAVATMTSGTNALTPACEVVIIQLVAGDAGTPAEQLVILKQSPVAYAEPATPLPAADIVATITQAGSGSDNKIYALTMTSGTYGGTFSVTLTTIASEVTSFITSGTTSAQDFQTLLAGADGMTTADVAVTRVGDVLNVQFQGSQQFSNAPLLSCANIDLLAPLGVTGTIALNTYNAYLAFANTTADELTYDFSIRRTRATGEEAEYFMHSVVMKRNLIDPSTMIPTPMASYYTSAQVDTLLAGKVPTTRTVNGHALSANVTVLAADIPSGQFPTGVAAVTQTPGDNSTKLATTEYVNVAIASLLVDAGTFAAILTAAGITPVADGTVTPVTSITTDTGVVTAVS